MERICCQAITFAEKAAFAAISLLVTVAAFAMLCFAAGISVGFYTLVLPAVLLLGISCLRGRGQFYAAVLVLAILALWTIVCGLIFDWSYDGMYYHKQAIITLKEGWNPLRQSSIEADVFASYPNMSLWLDNYPKGIWIFSAAIYAITNHLETAKAVNILFLLPTFCIAYDVMRGVYGQSRGRSAALALLFVLNPVFICQVFTSYNDLAVGCCIIMTVLLCMKIYTERANAYTYILLFGIAAFSCTVKFTAPVFVGIILLVTGICYACKVKMGWIKLKRPVLIVLTGFLTGILLIGFDPYVKHLAEGKHIVYPVMGEGAYDIMNTNPPATLEEHGQLGKLFISLFSQTNNDIAQVPRLKIPFSIHSAELDHLSNADIRIGGFGVLFSGILILSLLLFLAAVCSRIKLLAVIGIFLCTFTLLTLFFPESWWARYTSYTYYIPVFILLYSMNSSGERLSWLKWFQRLIYALFLVNSAILIWAVLNTGIQTTAELNQKLAEVKATDKKVFVRVNDFPTHVKLFSEYGIDFEVVHHALNHPQIFYRNTKIEYVED